MEPVRLIAEKYGWLHTPWEVATDEYQQEMTDWQEALSNVPQLCVGLSVESEWPETEMLTEETGDKDAESILFGLFETGQVDHKRYKREFIFPSGKTITL